MKIKKHLLRLLWCTQPHKGNHNVNNDDNTEEAGNQGEGLSQLGSIQPEIVIVDVEVVVLHLLKEECLIG